jgi:hypothetical protein
MRSAPPAMPAGYFPALDQPCPLLAAITSLCTPAAADLGKPNRLASARCEMGLPAAMDAASATLAASSAEAATLATGSATVADRASPGRALWPDRAPGPSAARRSRPGPGLARTRSPRPARPTTARRARWRTALRRCQRPATTAANPAPGGIEQHHRRAVDQPIYGAGVDPADQTGLTVGADDIVGVNVAHPTGDPCDHRDSGHGRPPDGPCPVMTVTRAGTVLAQADCARLHRLTPRTRSDLRGLQRPALAYTRLDPIVRTANAVWVYAHPGFIPEPPLLAR